MSVERAAHSGNLSEQAFTGRPRVRSAGVGDRIAVDIYIVAELAAILATGLIVANLYVGRVLGVADYFNAYLTPLLFVPLVTVAGLNRRGLHGFERLCRFFGNAGAVAATLTAAFMLLAVAGFAAGVANDYSRVWFAGWYLLAMATVLALRLAASELFSRLSDAGVIGRTVLVYGHGRARDDVARRLRTARTGIRLAGVFGPAPARPKSPGDGLSGDGGIKRLIAFARENPVDAVILALPGVEAKVLKSLLIELSALPVEVQLYPGVDGARVPLRGVCIVERLALLDLQRKPIAGWGPILKAVEDYTLAAAALALMAPLFVLIAAAIKLDSAGPVLFAQRRHGLNHRVIRVLKFRTMQVMEDDDRFTQARRGDERVTRVGSILRRTSLDELPQLINVLRGEMSIVGPRPHPLALNDRYAGLLRHYENRHRVKPGITGWAQINGWRGPTENCEEMRRRVECDLEYIENWSLWMDFKVIAATPFVGFIHRNAV
jgi:putative colanic acid biosynthesis UDP-glucose lipid carrier transferase